MPQVREVAMKRARSHLRPKVVRNLTKRRKQLTKRFLLNRSKLIKLLDSLYSNYVRNFYAKGGVLDCYTCVFKGTVKTMQCGHYISRYFKNTRWLLNNLRPQCFMCNMRLGGCGHIFRAKLIGELGEAQVVEMERRAEQDFSEDDNWLVSQILIAKELCTTVECSLPASTVRDLSKTMRAVEIAKSLSITPTEVTLALIQSVESNTD